MNPNYLSEYNVSSDNDNFLLQNKANFRWKLYGKFQVIRDLTRYRYRFRR